MKNIICSNLVLLSFCLSFTGCSTVTEVAKVIWGSSTRALEDARAEALTNTYRCSYDDCFDAVLALSRVKPFKEAKTEEVFDLFIKNRIKKHMVVMGVEGNVDTTEVGIFFAPVSASVTRIEISSLSSSAKRKVAQAVFAELDLNYEVQK